jgi:hypothetical protein
MNIIKTVSLLLLQHELINLLSVGQPFAPSPRQETKSMSIETYHQLACALAFWYPETHLHCQGKHPIHPDSLLLDQSAIFFDYIIFNGSRYYASRSVGSNRASLVDVMLPTEETRSGEILELLQVQVNNMSNLIWVAHMRWFRPWDGPRERIWDDL